MQGKTVVITGATGGIGLETARGLAKLGARVAIVARSRPRGEAAIAEIKQTVPDAQLELALADLYSLAEIRQVGAELRAKHPKIDVLINNAGMIHGKRELTVDGFEKTFALNHLAPFLLTYELRDALVKASPARVVTLSSGGHNLQYFTWDDLATRNRWMGQTLVYGASKLCNIWFAKEAARRFASKGSGPGPDKKGSGPGPDKKTVTSNAVHPGVVATGFGQTGSKLFQIGAKLTRRFMLTMEQGARTSIYVASSPEVADVTGEYFYKSKVKTPSARARDAGDARTLWELSEKLCGISWS